MGLILLLPGLLAFTGFKYNVTNSLAPGVYRVVNKLAMRGDYAWFCPPDNAAIREALKRGYIPKGECAGGFIHFMKKVVATSGDKVTIDSSGVYVNDVLLDYSKPVERDSQGRKLLINNLTNYRMGNDEYLMMTDCNDKSFDARYFGIVKGMNTLKLNKVFTW